MSRALCALTAVSLLSIVPSWGDAILEVRVGGDELVDPARPRTEQTCRPCVPPARPGETVTLHVAGDRIRRDRGPLSVIFDRSKRKIDFLCAETRQYSELGTPVNYHRALPNDFRRTLDEIIRFDLTAPGTTRSGEVGPWKVETFEAAVANGLREMFTVRVSVADALPGETGLLLELRKMLHELERFGQGWSRFLPFATGVPIVWEERQRQPTTEFVYREEVTKIDIRALPPETFQVPKDYKKIRYQKSCFPTR